MNPVPIQLSDAYIGSVLSDPAVTTVFPHLGELARQLKRTQLDCHTCGAGTRQLADELQKVRDYILDLPDVQLQQLKNALRIPNRQFIAYRNRGVRSTRCVR